MRQTTLQTVRKEIWKLTIMIFLAVFCVILSQSVVSAQVEAGQIAFTATLRKDLTVGAEHHIVYTDVYTNHGGAYSPHSGFFTVPRDGLYAFHIHALAQEAKSVSIDLYVDQKYYISSRGQSIKFASAGNQIILNLVKGNQVYVRTRQESNFYGRAKDAYINFSGYYAGLPTGIKI